MKKRVLIVCLFVFILSSLAPLVEAKGGSSSGGSRSSSSSRTAPKSAAQIKADRVVAQRQAAATAKQQAQEQKYKTASSQLPTNKTKNGKTYTKGKTIGVDGYQPRFRNGYQAPAGSTVYYDNGFSAWSMIPLWYIMTHDGSQNVVVQQPDGKEVQIKEEGADGMYVFNWIITILLGVGLIGLVIYLVNKYTQKKGGGGQYATY